MKACLCSPSYANSVMPTAIHQEHRGTCHHRIRRDQRSEQMPCHAACTPTSTREIYAFFHVQTHVHVHWHCPAQVKTQPGNPSHYSGSALTMFGGRVKSCRGIALKGEGQSAASPTTGKTTYPSGGQIRRCCSFERRVSMLLVGFLQSQTDHIDTHRLQKQLQTFVRLENHKTQALVIVHTSACLEASRSNSLNLPRWLHLRSKGLSVGNLRSYRLV